MPIENRPTILIPNASHVEEARMVAEWTAGAGTMLGKTPEQILELFGNGWSVMLLAAESGVPIAHAAITYTWPGNWVEVGALYVPAAYRKQDLGRMATKLVLELAGDKYPGANIFALCNQYSRPIFEGKFGGKKIDYRVLPPEVFGACVNCPSFQKAHDEGKLCCDTPIEMTGAEL